jgi:pSer/pThr/pTyr-binding forkhead associated (FHA) protein
MLRTHADRQGARPAGPDTLRAGSVGREAVDEPPAAGDLEDRYASGLHARVFAREGRTFVEDMSSTNGTLLNSAELKGEAELIDGDTVRIGDTEFRFEAG